MITVQLLRRRSASNSKRIRFYGKPLLLLQGFRYDALTMKTKGDISFLTEMEQKALQQFLDRVRTSLGKMFIRSILFGSRARGEGHEESDLDVLVLVTSASLKTKHTVWDIATDLFLETDINISPLVLEEGQFQHLHDLERLIAEEITTQGISL